MPHNHAVQLVQHWIAAVCSRNIADVLEKYSESAVLIGTLADRILCGPEIAGYFHMFLDKEDICGNLDEIICQPLADSIIASGVYTFTWIEKGKQQEVKARFSFVFSAAPTISLPSPVSLTGEQSGWLIQNHHSSKVP